MQIQRFVLLQCFPSEHPPCIFPSLTNWSPSFTFLGCKRLRGENRPCPPAAGAAVPGVSAAVPARPALPGPRAVLGQSRCPHPPARPAGSRGARPGPRAVSGTENKAGASPPHRPAQTSSLENLPVFHKAASHGHQPNRNSCEAGHARWVRHILPVCLLELLPPTSPAKKRGCADTLEPFPEAALSFGTFGTSAVGEAEVCLPLQIGSKPAEQLRY